MKKVRWWIAGLLAVVGVLLIGVLVWAQQERAMLDRAREGREHLAAGRPQEALELVERVVRRRPELELAWRVRVEALAALNSRMEIDSARDLWQRFPSTDTASRLVQAAMRWNDEDAAREFIASPVGPEVLGPANRFALEAMVAARWGHFSAARAAFDRALAHGYPHDDQARLTAGILKVQEGDISGGVAELEAIPADARLYPEATRSLVRVYRALGQVEDLQRHAEAFFRSPGIPVGEKLDVLDFLHGRAGQSWTEAALDWIWRSARTGAAVADLLIWCYLEERATRWADEAVASLPEPAFENEPLRLLVAARARQIARQDPDAPARAVLPQVSEITEVDSPYASLLRLARLRDEGSAPGMVRQRVDERALHGSLTASPVLVNAVDRFARAFDLREVWESALLRLSRESNDTARTSIGLLYRMYSEDQDTAALFRLMERAYELNPDNPVTRNNLAQLGLLLGRNTERSHHLADETCAYSSQSVHFASTSAYSLLLRGRPDEALALLEAHPPAALAEAPVAPYYAAVLAANGRGEEARTLARTTPQDSLLPEERAIVRRILDE